MSGWLVQPAWADTPPEVRVVRVGVVTHSDRELLEAAASASDGRVRLRVVPLASAAKARKALRAGHVDASAAESGEALKDDATVCRVAYTVTYPMGLYAKDLAALRQVPIHASVTVPADREGQGRALLLLQHHGLIRIERNAGLQPQVHDIVDNPRKLQFRRMPQGKLASALRGDGLVALPYADADAVGLAPARDALGMEDARIPWANALAVRAADCTAKWVAPTVAALHSPTVKSFILTRFNDSVRRPW